MLKLITTLFLISSMVVSTLKITTTYKVEDGLPDNSVRSMIQDKNGAIWVAGGNGIAFFTNSKWSKDDNEENPVTGGTPSIFQDSQDRIWFGGIGVIHVYDGTDYQSFSIEQDLKITGRLIFSFFEDRDGNVWAAGAGGASMFSNEEWTPLTTSNGLLHNVVHDINQDTQGRLWFATRKGGLNIYDGNEWKYFYPEKNCRKIVKDELGNLWVGTNDGILKYGDSKWLVLEEGKTTLPMFQGDKKYLWCVSDGKSILRIPVNGIGKQITYESVIDGYAEEIYHLQKTSSGSVWAGTDNGIVVFH